MKLAASNIAWRPEQTRDAYTYLQKAGFHGVEIAPGILFPDAEDILNPSDAQLKSALDMAAEYDLVFASMQSLHFGVEDVALFGDHAQRDRFLDTIHRAGLLAHRLGFSNLVIGSPKARIVPEDMSKDEAIATAASGFLRIADLLAPLNVDLAIEPNPAAYGTNFLTNISDVIAFAKTCNHEHITINFDVGSLKMNDEFSDIEQLFTAAKPHVSHVHMSEPFLSPELEADEVSRTMVMLKTAGYDRFVSIEMKGEPPEQITNLERATSILASAAR